MDPFESKEYEIKLDRNHGEEEEWIEDIPHMELLSIEGDIAHVKTYPEVKDVVEEMINGIHNGIQEAEEEEDMDLMVRDDDGRFRETTLNELLGNIGGIGIDGKAIEKLTRLLRGDVVEFNLTDGWGDQSKIKLSYNDDQEGFFYMRMYPPEMKGTIPFVEVEKAGKDAYFLVTKRGCVAMTLKNVESGNGYLKTIMDILGEKSGDE